MKFDTGERMQKTMNEERKKRILNLINGIVNYRAYMHVNDFVALGQLSRELVETKTAKEENKIANEIQYIIDNIFRAYGIGVNAYEK